METMLIASLVFMVSIQLSIIIDSKVRTATILLVFSA